MKAVAVILLLFPLIACTAQEPDIKSLLRKIKDRSDEQVLRSNEVRQVVLKSDSISGRKTVEELQARSGKNLYGITRVLLLKAALASADLPYHTDLYIQPVIDIYEKALKKAIETGDELLIAECCRNFGLFCVTYNLLDKAMFYLLKSMELQEKHGFEKFANPGSFRIDIGNVLYKVQEYELCIQHTKQGLSSLGESYYPSVYNIYNTVGLAFQKIGKYDSALNWYRRALPLSIQAKDTAWTGIITGNIGDVYFLEKKYDSAKQFLLDEYNLNRQKEFLSGYNSLQWVARILALQGKPDSALVLIKELDAVLPDRYFQDNRNFYETKAEVFRILNRSDSALYYYRLYQHTNDSVKERMMQSRMDITQIRLDYEKSHNQVDRMVKEKKHEKTKRNLLAAGIILVILAGFLLYRMQRHRNQLQQKLLLQQKQAAEEATSASRQQLDLFTAHIVEKNEMIEKLQEQLQRQNQQVNDELLRQTILTDDDWLQFKQLFEKARPGFFEKMQRLSPGITAAELRLAALISLNLDNKHIAAMQGISADTIRKSKSRLRQRLNITLEEGLEEFIRNI